MPAVPDASTAPMLAAILGPFSVIISTVVYQEYRSRRERKIAIQDRITEEQAEQYEKNNEQRSVSAQISTDAFGKQLEGYSTQLTQTNAFWQVFVETIKKEHEAHIARLIDENAVLTAEIKELKLQLGRNGPSAISKIAREET